MKLISMVEFVLQQNFRLANKEITYNECGLMILKYANFLKQSLKLEMFVPCDEEGDILEEPTNYEQRLPNMMTEYNDEIYRYKQAKEKVLFEGFHIEGNKLCYSYFYFGIIYDISNLKVENLLSELPENEMPKLMLSAVKQIGL